jgi:hypothetical protein
MVSANTISVDQVLVELGRNSPDLTAQRKAFVGRLVRAGQIKLKPSLSENLVRVWIGSEIRDGNEELGRNVLEAIYAVSFGTASGRAVLVVLDAENPALELGRFSWLGGLEAI